jgi:hypothetical protein
MKSYQDHKGEILNSNQVCKPADYALAGYSQLTLELLSGESSNN